MLPVQAVKRPMHAIICWLAAALLAWGLPFCGEAKSYSSGGGRSYSSHSSSSRSSHSPSSRSSHTFSSGGGRSFKSGASRSSSGGSARSSSSGSSVGSRKASVAKSTSASHATSSSPGPSSGSSGSSKTFQSSSGKSYSSGSTWRDSGRHSYTSAKSYSSGAGHMFTSVFGRDEAAKASTSRPKSARDASEPQVIFDQAAARARKQEASQSRFTQFKESQLAPPTVPSEVAPSSTPSVPQASTPGAPSYRVKPPPLPVSTGGASRPVGYVPDAGVLSSRPARMDHVFNPYSSRPAVVYRDPYSSLFWWWLLDRSLDDRASWAYHHRYDMDPARYQALVTQDQQLEARVEQLEAQQAPRDPNYTPPGVDRDLMYSDHHVQQTYSNRPTTAGIVVFWMLAVPTALAVCAFFIWLIWFKRWQPAT